MNIPSIAYTLAISNPIILGFIVIRSIYYIPVCQSANSLSGTAIRDFISQAKNTAYTVFPTIAIVDILQSIFNHHLSKKT